MYFYLLNFIILLITVYLFNRNIDYEDQNILNKRSTNVKLVKKIGLLTNEIPPIIYGGVATWIVNFINMFKNNEKYEIIPIFLAYMDEHRVHLIENKYDKLRIIKKKEEIEEVFSDIDICLNNIWISLDTITEIKRIFPKMPVISVCHSLIQKEHLTNLGSVYTNNFFDQEITFMNSDVVVLISQAEEKYYKQFGYDKFGAETFVIYNSYIPKYDDKDFDFDYSNHNPGYIGRHVPRKRPELPILSVKYSGRKDINVFNMGVDYKNGSNAYWEGLEKIFEEQLKIIPFTSDKSKIEEY